MCGGEAIVVVVKKTRGGQPLSWLKTPKGGLKPLSERGDYGGASRWRSCESGKLVR